MHARQHSDGADGSLHVALGRKVVPLLYRRVEMNLSINLIPEKYNYESRMPARRESAARFLVEIISRATGSDKTFNFFDRISKE